MSATSWFHYDKWVGFFLGFAVATVFAVHRPSTLSWEIIFISHSILFWNIKCDCASWAIKPVSVWDTRALFQRKILRRFVHVVLGGHLIFFSTYMICFPLPKFWDANLQNFHFKMRTKWNLNLSNLKHPEFLVSRAKPLKIRDGTQQTEHES